jgi:putative two-component system response regulator
LSACPDGPPADEEGAIHLLIAEDDAASRELLVALVEGLGYTATVVPDGEAALAAVRGEQPALVLSDVTMPGLSGFDLCRRLKADPTTRLIPVVLITGIGEEFKAAGIEAGADDFLSKPVSRAELTIRLRALLRMKAFTDELESAETVLFSLAKTIEAKDTVTGDHCERLATLAVALGRRRGLGEADLHALHRGGYLHDLGKVGIPEVILCKPGPLIPEEWQVMRRHPAIGEALCRPLRSLRRVLPIIRHHHERWDGSGYPDGLREEAIPLTARVLQVVDIYDALRSDRPYRRALAPEAALALLAAETRKGWWDSAIVATMAGMLAELEAERT